MYGEQLQFLTVRNQEKSETRRIAYRFMQPQPGRPVLMWFSGFKSDMESTKASELATWAAARGLGLLRFDYSGHGRSEGRFEEAIVSHWLEEAQAVSSLHATATGPYIFIGSSMGAWIALLLARRLLSPSSDGGTTFKIDVIEHGLQGLVLIAPAWDMTRLMWNNASEEARAALLRDGVYRRPSAYSNEPYAITRTLIEDGARHLFGARPISMPVPVRILHGQRDVDVPWRHSIELLDVLSGDDIRLTLIKDAEHRLSRPQDLAVMFAAINELI